MKRSPLRRGKPIRRQPFKRKPSRNLGFSEQVREELHKRCLGRCEANASRLCTGCFDHAHHKRLRSQGGPNTLDNALAVCWVCHDEIHGHPEESRKRGWISGPIS